jgi:hypothetical protein
MNKTCNKCNSEKSTSEFSVNNRNKDKLEATCKDCIKAKNKQNRDKQTEAQRKWREKNPDYMKKLKKEKNILNNITKIITKNILKENKNGEKITLIKIKRKEKDILKIIEKN